MPVEGTNGHVQRKRLFFEGTVQEAIDHCSSNNTLLLVFLLGLDPDSVNADIAVHNSLKSYQRCLGLRLFDDLANKDPYTHQDAKHFREIFSDVQRLPFVMILSPDGEPLAQMDGPRVADSVEEELWKANYSLPAQNAHETAADPHTSASPNRTGSLNSNKSSSFSHHPSESQWQHDPSTVFNSHANGPATESTWRHTPSWASYQGASSDTRTHSLDKQFQRPFHSGTGLGSPQSHFPGSGLGGAVSSSETAHNPGLQLNLITSFPRTEATSLAEMLGKASAQAAYVAAGNTWNERQNQQTATIHTAPSTPHSRFSSSMRNPSQEPVSPQPAQATAFGGGFHGLGYPRPSTSSMASQDLSGFREQGSMAASESTQAASSQAGHTVPHHWHRNSVFEASRQHPSMDPTASAAQAQALHKRTHEDHRQEHVQDSPVVAQHRPALGTVSEGVTDQQTIGQESNRPSQESLPEPPSLGSPAAFGSAEGLGRNEITEDDAAHPSLQGLRSQASGEGYANANVWVKDKAGTAADQGAHFGTANRAAGISRSKTPDTEEGYIPVRPSGEIQEATSSGKPEQQAHPGSTSSRIAAPQHLESIPSSGRTTDSRRPTSSPIGEREDRSSDQGSNIPGQPAGPLHSPTLLPWGGPGGRRYEAEPATATIAPAQIRTSNAQPSSVPQQEANEPEAKQQEAKPVIMYEDDDVDVPMQTAAEVQHTKPLPADSPAQSGSAPQSPRMTTAQLLLSFSQKKATASPPSSPKSHQEQEGYGRAAFVRPQSPSYKLNPTPFSARRPEPPSHRETPYQAGEDVPRPVSAFAEAALQPEEPRDAPSMPRLRTKAPTQLDGRGHAEVALPLSPREQPEGDMAKALRAQMRSRRRQASGAIEQGIAEVEPQQQSPPRSPVESPKARAARQVFTSQPSQDSLDSEGKPRGRDRHRTPRKGSRRRSTQRAFDAYGPSKENFPPNSKGQSREAAPFRGFDTARHRHASPITSPRAPRFSPEQAPKFDFFKMGDTAAADAPKDPDAHSLAEGIAEVTLGLPPPNEPESTSKGIKQPSGEGTGSKPTQAEMESSQKKVKLQQADIIPLPDRPRQHNQPHASGSETAAGRAGMAQVAVGNMPVYLGTLLVMVLGFISGLFSMGAKQIAVVNPGAVKQAMAQPFNLASSPPASDLEPVQKTKNADAATSQQIAQARR